MSGEPGLCAACGGQLRPVWLGGEPACYRCATDRATILCAVDVLRRRRRKRTFAGDVLIRVLERYADRLNEHGRAPVYR